MVPWISNTLLCLTIWLIYSIMLSITVVCYFTNVYFSFISETIVSPMTYSEVFVLLARCFRLWSNCSMSIAGLNLIFNFSPSFIKNLSRHKKLVSEAAMKKNYLYLFHTTYFNSRNASSQLVTCFAYGSLYTCSSLFKSMNCKYFAWVPSSIKKGYALSFVNVIWYKSMSRDRANEASWSVLFLFSS